MKWSWRLFTAFGIGVYVHVTFLLLLLLFLIHPLASGKGGLMLGLLSVFLILAVFACVLLHEFGHALTARRFGVQTRDITLLPIGGLARLERIPTDPRQELLIAIAGPAVNLAIAGLLLPLGYAFGGGPEVAPTRLTLSGGGFLWELFSINLWLAVFNFVPAYPMDGGRVLRALLALKMDYLQATRIAVGVGQALAFAFGLFGLLNENFILILIAFFVYLGAAQEGSIVQYRRSFQGLPASCAMITNFNALQDTDRLEKAVEYLLIGSQIDFPVMSDGKVLGLLTRGALIDSLGKHGPHVTLANLPIRPVGAIDHDLPLDIAYDSIQSQGVRCLPVLRRGALVGLITLDNLAEFAMVQSAMKLGVAKRSAERPT